jgi:ABC-2 type transport system ATP-binding protein
MELKEYKMEKVLEVKGLTKLYKNNRGIRNINFEIYKGDIYGFLGPNGAGKTTTMKMITGLCRAYKGEIKVFGTNISENFEAAMKKVGCLIEKPEAYEYMSGYKNLEMAARYYSDLGKSRIEEVLEIVGLKQYMHERAGVYSLGMKQRLGLAAAILSRPELVILDEPANGLDIEGMVDIRNVITSLAEEYGTTFFISSHLVHEMELTCSRIGIIYDGQLIASGTIEELLQNHPSLEDYFIKQVAEGRRLKQ